MWRRVTHPPHIRIEHVTRLQPRLVVVIPLIAFKLRVVMMLFVILTCSLALIVIELPIMLLVLAVILTLVVLVVLCHCKTAGQSKQNCSTSGYPPLSFHVFSNRFSLETWALKFRSSANLRLHNAHM